MAELSVEQKRAIAAAKAKKRAAQAEGAVITPDPMVADLPPELQGGEPERREHYVPSSMPLLDPINAFGTSLVENIPVVGGPLNEVGHNVDAWWASLLEGREVSPEERARITQAEQEAFPAASISGGAAGMIGPLGALAKIPAVARAFGLTGSLPARMVAGGASGMGISGADAFTRGGDAADIIEALSLGGGAGAAFPLAGRAVASVVDKFAGKAVPAEMRSLVRALGDDDIPIDQLPQRLRDMGDDAMVMDLGPNTQSQAGAIAATPGQGQTTVRKAVADRAQGASARVAADVDATVGTGEDLFTLTNRITREQAEAAGPLYTAVRDIPLQEIGPLKTIMQRPSGRQALQQALKLAADEGYHFPVSGDLMTVGMADYMKRALDDMAATAARSGENNRARIFGNMARSITGFVDQQVPAYKQARDAFAGPAKVLEAIETGQGLFSKETSPAQLRSMLDNMTSSEVDGVLAGFQAGLEAQLGNAVNDALSLRNALRKGWNEQKLRILLGDEVADDLLRRVDREAAFSQTTNVVSRNSETARRQAAQKEVSPEFRDLRSTSLTGLILDTVNKARASLRGKFQPKVNQRLAAALSSGADDIDANFMRLLAQAAKPRPNELVAPAVPGLALTGPDQ